MHLSKTLLTISIWSACQLVYAAPQEQSTEAVAAAAQIEPEYVGVQAVDPQVEAAQAEAPPENGYEGSTLGQMERRYRRYVRETLAARPRSAKCNSRNVILRKYWGAMKKQERINYTKAVKCLYNKQPPLSSTSVVPGARNRLDDFVAAHIQESDKIHFNGYLFAWHRHFVYLYDQALRNECGYRGPTPYWDWTRHAQDPRRSPVFDGSETSMGGNGETIPHGITILRAFGLELPLEPGTGGGCVKEGPFTDLVVNLGLNPVMLPVGQTADVPLPKNDTGRNEGALNYNPRCLTRDINIGWSTKTRRIDVEYLLQCPDVACLERRADGWGDDNQAPTNGRFVRASKPQVHPAGHFAVGGLQNDPFASPGDPVFYLHHAQFDRVWAIWQGQDPKRVNEVGGPVLPFGGPTTPQVKREDRMGFGVVGSDLVLGDGLSTIDGPYCYIYV